MRDTTVLSSGRRRQEITGERRTRRHGAMGPRTRRSLSFMADVSHLAGQSAVLGEEPSNRRFLFEAEQRLGLGNQDRRRPYGNHRHVGPPPPAAPGRAQTKIRLYEQLA